MNTHITMKELPESEQPLEKCIRYGAHVLSDAELLAAILKNGTRDMTALQLAQLFLSQKEKNLLNLTAMGTEEMQKLPGIGQVKAAQLKCVAELARRIAKASRVRDVRLNEPATRFVTARSASLGAGSPLGWLWRSTMWTAPYSSAFRKISLGDTSELVAVPTEMISSPKRLLFASNMDNNSFSFVSCRRDSI